ncbi:MAG: ATP-grasp domain-containing protein [Chloroflexota bacterium]
MTVPYQVLIAYRPFHIDDPNLAQTVATDATIQAAFEALQQAGFDVSVLSVGADIANVLRHYDPRHTVIFNYCDGFDDDPTGYDPVTGIFERLGFAYTGAHDAILLSSQDKGRTKVIMEREHISTPTYRIYEQADVNGWNIFPALVKPVRKHGSLGITPESVVETPEQLARQVGRVLNEWQQPALVEDFIDGTEYRVSVWGNAALEVLPLMSIQFLPMPERPYGMKDFDTKWLEHGMQIDIPAKVEPGLLTRIEQVAMQAFRALEMRDYGGIDIRVRDGIPYVIDPNANADICDVSSFSQMARAAGYDYATVLARIVGLAAERIPGT